MCEILNEELSDNQRIQIRKKEERRISMANNCLSELISEDILLVQGTIWGFDLWYKQAPIVVSYSQRHQSITVGCVSEEKVIELLGKNGLIEVFTKLGGGWGGRETIGGSPRHKKLSFADARQAGLFIASMLSK